MGRTQRRMHHHLSSLKSQRDRFPCSSLMQALGQCKRERSGVRANEMMAADGVGELDWMRVLQEAPSFEKFMSKTFSCIMA